MLYGAILRTLLIDGHQFNVNFPHLVDYLDKLIIEHIWLITVVT